MITVRGTKGAVGFILMPMKQNKKNKIKKLYISDLNNNHLDSIHFQKVTDLVKINELKTCSHI